MNDNIFDALGSVRRRRVLLGLVDHNPQHVTEHVVRTREHGTADEGLVRFQHVHLPKLDSYGFVDWNRDAQTITRGPRFDEIEPVLELLATHRDVLPDELV